MKEAIGMRAFSVLLAVLLVSVMMVPAVSAESTHDVKGVKYPSVTVTDDEIRDAIEGVIKEIENSGIDPKEKVKLVSDLRTIVSESPIPMDELEKALLTAGEALFGQNPPFSTKQAGGVHQDMAYIAGQKMYLGTAECNELWDHADDPDGMGSYCLDHYALTGAPGEAERLANIARGQFSINNRILGSEYLANSMHYMTDMSVPFHYVYEALLYHMSYEPYVANNWDEARDFTGSCFRTDATSPTYYYVINDVSDAASNLAQFSHQYLDYIVYQMANNPNWKEDPYVIAYTRNCISDCTKYNMGLVDYVTR